MLVNDLDENSRKIFSNYLKEKVIASHCRGHNCIILLFDFKYFEDTHRRLSSRNFFYVNNKYVLTMGTRYSKKPKIKIVVNIKKGFQYNYLRPNVETVLTIDKIYSFPLFNNYIDGWYSNSVRLWQKTK